MGVSSSKESIVNNVGNSTSKESIEFDVTLASKQSIEFDATLSSCFHLMQLLRSKDTSIHTAALASLKQITANSSLIRALVFGRDQSSSPAAAILFPAIVHLLQDCHVMPPINVSISLDILLNLVGYLDDKTVKMVYQATGLAKVLNIVFFHEISEEIQIKIRLLQDKDERSVKRSFAPMEAGRYGHPDGYSPATKFKFQPALIEANIGKWVQIMTILEDFVFYGKLASADTKMGKFTVTETVQVIKRAVGRNWDFKEFKSLQIFFFDDCRTVEVVPKELVESMLAPWDDEDEDDETKKQKDNMLKPWSKKANADTSNDVDNRLTSWGDHDDDNTKKENKIEKIPIIDRNRQAFIRL